jgi:hypothetical protein
MPSIPLIAPMSRRSPRCWAVGITVNVVPIPFGTLGAELQKGAFPIAFAPAVQFHPQTHLEL